MANPNTAGSKVWQFFRSMGVIPPVAVGLSIVLLIIMTAVLASHKSSSDLSQLLPSSHRINCYPEVESPYSGYSKEACLARNCLYDDQDTSNATQCYLSPYYGYILQQPVTQTSNGLQLQLQRNQAVGGMFPETIENVILEVQYYTNDIIRFKLYDANNQRYEVPIPIAASPGNVQSPQYAFNYTSNATLDNILSFSITRRLDNAILFDTSLGGLVLNNQFLQIVSRLQSPHVYGFGENNHDTLKHNVTQRPSWGIFSRDQGSDDYTNENQYGTHPFYLVMEETGNSSQTPTGRMHGVLLINSNAMDYSFDEAPSVTIRTIGGILDFFVFLGPNPEQVIQQYTWLVGRTLLPPYWGLGFQLSRWGYYNTSRMQFINERNRAAGVPLDVQFADIDYMDAQRDFTVDPVGFKGLKEFFQQIRAGGMRTIIILDPALAADESYYQPTIEGIKEDVFIKWDNGTIMKGPVWPGPAYLPDFFTQRTQTWWTRWITNFRAVNLTFDGLWIDMNEPSVFGTNTPFPWDWEQSGSNYTLQCPQSILDDPPYRTKAAYRWDVVSGVQIRLSDRTFCMAALQGENSSATGKPMYRHYDVHSLYGWSETIATLNAVRSVTGQRGLVLPRSTFVGSGQWAGHWLGDNDSTWSQLKRSLIGLVEFNWFGIALNGADICGFNNVPTEELCTRWMQVGAFYPFSRNHNIRLTPDQDPAAWSPPALAAMIAVLRIRYTLLPYYYTLFYNAHTNGSTVIRPLFHEYPTDVTTFDITLQFLVGASIMIAPVTDAGAVTVQAYIPSLEWYDYYSGNQAVYSKQFVTLQAPLSTIPIFLRSGSIIPTQQYANNTFYSRQNPFGLIIVVNDNGDAQGNLFYDDGQTINTTESNSYYYANFQWSSSNQKLTMTVLQNNYPGMSNLILDTISVYGLKGGAPTLSVNNQQFNFQQRNSTQIMDISGLALPMINSYTLTFSNTTSSVVQVPNFIVTNPQYRVDCYPESNGISSECLARGCVWDSTATTTSGYPSCYVPIGKGGYNLTQSPVQLTSATTQYTLSRVSTKPVFNSSSNSKSRITRRQLSSNVYSIYGQDIDKLNATLSISGPNMIRFTIRDANNSRYEVPVPIQWQPAAVSSSAQAKIQFVMTETSNGQAGFRVIRTDTQSIIFDTTYFAHGFTYSDRYIQFITTIPSANAYGFGENGHTSFRHILNDSYRYGIFGRDQPPQGQDENLYGTHPFYMSIENDGKAFGVLIFNSNAQDYKFDQFENNQSMLTYRTIGGVLDLFFFAGPNPEDVIRQYQTVIGNPYMPPYWGLGFQLCRYGYETLDNMKAALERTLNGSIPIDVMYGDIDYFRLQLDFTWDPVRFNGLPDFVNSLHAQGMKFITILDPTIDSQAANYTPYSDGEAANVWIKWPANLNLQFNETNNRNLLGYVWPVGKAVFPDYFYPPTKDWWKTQIVNYHAKLPFDALWIDMNEPANFGTNELQPWNWPYAQPWSLHCPLDEPLETPPYKTAIWGPYLSDKTVCMVAQQTDGQGTIYNHYDVHNLFGWSETLATLPAARAATGNKRSYVISRSTFPSSGTYAGHWLGDNTSLWPFIKLNIIGMLEFNLFGIPYIGADICGFQLNRTEQMCQRWMQLGAFNPFFRNHNSINNMIQDPGSFSPAVVDSNRRAVETRYTLIPYLYTLFHQVHVSGGTIVRSMAHVFPTDSTCWSLDEQFLWDSYLLVAPVIYENQTTKDVYLPSTERWFNYYTGDEQMTLGQINVTADYDYLPLFVRGGVIIPRQQSAMNTNKSRLTPMNLLIALDKQGGAEGNLFWDDGDSIDTYENSVYNYFNFTYVSQVLAIGPSTYNYPQMGSQTKLDEITIYGVTKQPASIQLNGQDFSSSNWTFNSTSKVFKMQTLALDLSKLYTFTFS